MPVSNKITIINAQNHPRNVIIEPWACDVYTLLKDESLQIVGLNDDGGRTPWFAVIE